MKKDHTSIEGCVAQYLIDKKDCLPSLYTWKFTTSIATERFGISFSGQTPFEKVMELKNSLRKQVASSTCTIQQGEIAKYFIKEWGGIRRFTKVEETLRHFSGLKGSSIAPQRLKIPFQGISSWSKWASIVCPDWACIYDARVAYALNAINYLAGANQLIFQVPPGQNSRLRMLDINTLLLSQRLQNGESSDPAKMRINHFIPKPDTYLRYLALLRGVSNAVWNDTSHIHEVEMLLFALADGEIYSDVFERLSANSPNA
ncbi:hypothetical protein AEQ67_28505 [Pseudomonas sp. RIT-PI-q]|uniref:hypothetical protein n=1 Tax=Pseudomonas sp. RIT-PI-q TaxID=1690247 RepID=UPI0006CDE0D4|nr:hypothetical protein [Pseudomonas sp. RIT-PI-q]KPG91922.1 hypothetical protein AEQ67_28505 [Pseudomonas sp. RIT-PI-q]